MAELLLGLAKSAVEGTLTMANSAIEEEEKLQKSVKCDLMLISDEFEMMLSFLNVAKEHVTNDMERTLVRQVRNMALDVEDCIESVVHLDNKSSWWRRLLPSCTAAAAPAVALDDAVANMEVLKARVEAMGQRNMRYIHIGDSCSKSSEEMHQHALANATALDILVEARHSREEKGLFNLLKLIINTEYSVRQLEVISVWGTSSNVGMTSIIKEAYDNPEICKNFLLRAWVKLMHPFNPYEFIQSLMFQFYSNSCQQYGSNFDLLKPIEVIETTKRGLIEEFKKQVNNHRYLLILEDMSSMDDLDAIKAYLPDNKIGSCIIVHTQKVEIASMCIGQSYRVSELKQFSDDHSVCMFFKEDQGKCVLTTKEKAASAWLTRFGHVRVGREIDLSVLHVAVNAAETDIIVVWGIAGVGKSYIIRHLYCSEVMARRDNTFESFGWVNVSYPLNIRDLSQSLLLDLRFESLQHGSMVRIKDPVQECCDLLHEHRCLVVIDGIRSVEEWDLIKATFALGATESSHRSCIVVITNEEIVAAHCAAKTSWNVKGLEVDESVDLFTKKVAEKTESDYLSTEVMEQAKQMLHKSGGIPKVIVAIVDFLSAQLNGNKLDLESWWMLNHSFIHELSSNRAFGSLQSLFSWVHSYFFTCPDFLKPCVFYLSIFPINQKLRRRRLVRRWIAEGYCRDNKRNTAEETAEEFISKLVDLCMIRMLGSAILASSFRMSLCQINGFFREYIMSRPMEENLVFTLEGSCSINSQRTGRHLAIGSSWDRDRNVFESMDFSKLRSLTVFGQWKPFFISEEMGLLRVLDLEDALGVEDKDMEHMVKLLPRLKFLSLSGCRNVSRLPDSLGDLRQLQTLDIRGTSVSKLPKSIIKLNKLQFIRAGTTEPLNNDTGTLEILSAPPAENLSLSTPSMSRTQNTPVSWLSKFCMRHQIAGPSSVGVMVPQGIGRLRTLNSLGVIEISVARGEAILSELKNLTLLRKLGVSGINRNNSRRFFSAISSHRHLEFLSVKLGSDNEGCMDGISLPPETNLKSLKLSGHLGKLPVWIKHLQNLTRLHLETTTLPQEEIDLLDNLPKLAILCLSFEEFHDGELRFHNCFRLVHILEITCSSRLKAVRFPAQGFSNLVALKLHCTNELHFEVFGLSYLKNLKEAWLSGSHNEPLKQDLRSQLAEHPSAIKPVLREGPRCRWS